MRWRGGGGGGGGREKRGSEWGEELKEEREPLEKKIDMGGGGGVGELGEGGGHG